jgi:hypothetical protein
MRKKRFLRAVILLSFFVCIFPGRGYAQHGADGDMEKWLGMDLETAFKRFGTPQEVFSYRSAAAADNVVFFYKNHFYLFWYENRVWVIRFDERYEGEFLGLTIGMSRENVLQVLGRAFTQAEDSLVFYLPDRGYPVRLRLFFKGDVLSDAYLYRGDF